jgi:hypothetical protein
MVMLPLSSGWREQCYEWEVGDHVWVITGRTGQVKSLSLTDRDRIWWSSLQGPTRWTLVHRAWTICDQDHLPGELEFQCRMFKHTSHSNRSCGHCLNKSELQASHLTMLPVSFATSRMTVAWKHLAYTAFPSIPGLHWTSQVVHCDQDPKSTISTSSETSCCRAQHKPESPHTVSWHPWAWNLDLWNSLLGTQ